MGHDSRIKPKEKRSLLIKEYEVCQSIVRQLDQSIWQTFSSLGVITAASFIYLSQSANVNAVLSVAFGGFVSVATWIWWGMANRWWDIQHATLFRIWVIETELEVVFQHRYIKCRDGQLEPARIGVPEVWHKHLGSADRFHRGGVRKYLRFFPPLVTVLWAIFGLLKLDIIGG